MEFNENGASHKARRFAIKNYLLVELLSNKCSNLSDKFRFQLLLGYVFFFLCAGNVHPKPQGLQLYMWRAAPQTYGQRVVTCSHTTQRESVTAVRCSASLTVCLCGGILSRFRSDSKRKTLATSYCTGHLLHAVQGLDDNKELGADNTRLGGCVRRILNVKTEDI